MCASKADLLEEIETLEAENQELRDRLGQIEDLASDEGSETEGE